MRLEAVILPDLGTGPDVPIVVSHWFASRGDEVWEGDRLVEVLVGPATFDVPSPISGRLAEIREREDDAVAPGAVLGLVAASDDDADLPPPPDRNSTRGRGPGARGGDDTNGGGGPGEPGSAGPRRS